MTSKTSNKPLKNFPPTMSQREVFDFFRDPQMIDKLPALSPPKNCDFVLVPAFGGVLVRFLAKSRVSDFTVSVYLDASNSLGCVNEPYWEIYPDKDGDTSRFILNESEAMMEAVKESIWQSVLDG